jgi:hypothetical protein
MDATDKNGLLLLLLLRNAYEWMNMPVHQFVGSSSVTVHRDAPVHGCNIILRFAEAVRMKHTFVVQLPMMQQQVLSKI